jgi:para-nitrobenzyl esterase
MRDDATRFATAVLAELGVSIDDRDLPSNGSTAEGRRGLLAELAELPIERLLACQERIGQTHGFAAFAPYVDRVTVPERPIDLIRAGSADGIPLLLGSNRDEWTLFEVFLGEVTVDGFKAPLHARLGPELDRLLEIYRDGHPGRSLARAWVDIIGELVFRIPMIRLAEAQVARGVPVYMYRFDVRSPAFGGRLGAAHALELPFVWNRFDHPMAQILLGDGLLAAQALATAMHMTWVQFIKTGSPDGGGLPAWPRYDVERRPTMLLDREPQVADDPGGTARAAWPLSWPVK